MPNSGFTACCCLLIPRNIFVFGTFSAPFYISFNVFWTNYRHSQQVAELEPSEMKCLRLRNRYKFKKMSKWEIKRKDGYHWNCRVCNARDLSPYILSWAGTRDTQNFPAPHLYFQDLYKTGMGARPLPIGRPLADLVIIKNKEKLKVEPSWKDADVPISVSLRKSVEWKACSCNWPLPWKFALSAPLKRL